VHVTLLIGLATQTQ